MFQIAKIAAIWLGFKYRDLLTKGLLIQCSLNVVEDESHLIICPRCASHRAKITQHFNNNTHFASQLIMSKFKWLLNNEDATVCKDIARFVMVCFFVWNK